MKTASVQGVALSTDSAAAPQESAACKNTDCALVAQAILAACADARREALTAAADLLPCMSTTEKNGTVHHWVSLKSIIDLRNKP